MASEREQQQQIEAFIVEFCEQSGLERSHVRLIDPEAGVSLQAIQKALGDHETEGDWLEARDAARKALVALAARLSGLQAERDELHATIQSQLRRDAREMWETGTCSPAEAEEALEAYVASRLSGLQRYFATSESDAREQELKRTSASEFWRGRAGAFEDALAALALGGEARDGE